MNTPLDLVGAPASVVTTPAQRSGAHERLSVPCMYCRSPILASTFAFWSNARRLMSATCPMCDRRVTIATSTWRRWQRETLA